MTKRLGNTSALIGLRGIAAVWVALFHFDIMFEKSSLSKQPGPRALLQHGYLAVDVFFVLSGFVMALSYGHYFEKGVAWRNYGVFLVRRLARVYPLYIAMTALTTALLMRHAGVLALLAGNGGELISNILMVQNWGISRTIVVAAWSVSVEALAYVGFPLLSLVFLYGPAALLVAAFALCLCGLVFIGFHPGASISSYVPTGMLDIHQDHSLLPAIRCLAGFGFGLCTYRYATSDSMASWRLPSVIGIAGTLLLVASLMVPGLDLLSVFLMPLLILCLLDDNFVARAVRTRAMIVLGEISYAVYLVHGDVLFLSKGLLTTHAAHVIGRPAAITLALAFFVAVTAAVSYAAHRLFEVPARAWVRRFETVFDIGAERGVLASERQGQADIARRHPSAPDGS